MSQPLESSPAPPSGEVDLAGESGRFVRFCLVGFVNTAISYGVFLALLEMGRVPYLLAGPIGFLSGAVTGFFLNRGWAFRSSIATRNGLIRYLAVQVVNLASFWTAQWFAGEVVGIPKEWTQLAGTGVSLFVHFTLLRLFVFNDLARADKALSR